MRFLSYVTVLFLILAIAACVQQKKTDWSSLRYYPQNSSDDGTAPCAGTDHDNCHSENEGYVIGRAYGQLSR